MQRKLLILLLDTDKHTPAWLNVIVKSITRNLNCRQDTNTNKVHTLHTVLQLSAVSQLIGAGERRGNIKMVGAPERGDTAEAGGHYQP